MKFIRAAGLVMLGSLAIARIAAPVHAQHTQVDAAAFAEFKKTCSAEMAKMKATLVSKGETMPDAEFDTYFASIPEQMRAMAELEERRADASYYREAAAKLRAEAGKPDADRTAGLATPVVLCYYDVLIRRETGAQAAPARPAVGEVDDADGPPSSSNPFTCVRVEKPGQFRNRCPFPVYFTYCGVNPEKDSWISDCAQQKMTGLLGAAAGGIQGGFTRAEKVYMFACEKPETPKDVRYIPGKGLYGSCK